MVFDSAKREGNASRRVPLVLTAEERAPLSVAVSRQLRQAIVTGKIAIGDELPSEKDLARELKVGRSTIREALRILQAQGLLSGGDTVSTLRPRVSAEHTLSTAAYTMENVLRLSKASLEDVVELRLLIEGAAVRKASKGISKHALADARAAVDAMKAKKIDVDTFRAVDLQFHRAIAAAAGNIAYSLVMNVLRDAISGHLGEALHREKDPQKTMARLTREHEAILIAVEQGKANRAAELIENHIRDFYKERQLASRKK